METQGIASAGHNSSAWILISSQLASKHASFNKHTQYHLSAAALQRRNAASCPITQMTKIFASWFFCYKNHSGEIVAPSLKVMGRLCSGGVLIALSTT